MATCPMVQAAPVSQELVQRGAYLARAGDCTACANRTFPNPVKNEPVNAIDPISLIRIVMAGSSMPSTQNAPSALAMPDFRWRLSDAEAADVVSFIRGSWGNHAVAVSRDEAGRVRKNPRCPKNSAIGGDALQSPPLMQKQR
jgi:hypothetical protein